MWGLLTSPRFDPRVVNRTAVYYLLSEKIFLAKWFDAPFSRLGGRRAVTCMFKLVAVYSYYNDLVTGESFVGGYGC